MKLPQTVAGFHSLVGLAAMTTSVAAYSPPISTIPPSQYAIQFMQFFQWKFRGVAHPLCPISAKPLENSHGLKESEQRNLEIELQKLKLMIASLVEKLTASEARVAQLES